MGHEKCGYRKHLKIPKNTFESHVVHVDRIHAGGCYVIISSELRRLAQLDFECKVVPKIFGNVIQTGIKNALK